MPSRPLLALKANDPCWCGSGRKFKRCHKASTEHIRPGRVSPTRPVPAEIPRPPYAETGVPVRTPEPHVRTPDVIERMRVAGRAAAEVLADRRRRGRARASPPTSSTPSATRSASSGAATPARSTTAAFPKSLCTSVNEVICHGIPDDRALVDGDIVNLDVTIFLDGVHGDTNATFPVGPHRPGVGRPHPGHPRVPRPGHRRGPAGPAGPRDRAGHRGPRRGHGYGVVRAFVGHGIAEQFHTDLQIPHYDDPPGHHGHRAGHDVHDRADDHDGRRGSTSCGTTTGRPSPSTGAAPPSSSTPCSSPTTASRSSPPSTDVPARGHGAPSVVTRRRVVHRQTHGDEWTAGGEGPAVGSAVLGPARCGGAAAPSGER